MPNGNPPYKNTEFCFICGGDTLSRMETWDGFDSLIKLCSFAAAARDEKDFADKVEYLRKKYVMTIDIIYPENFSSTQIRKRIHDGKTLEGIVPHQVESYIYERGLYGAKTDKTLSESESDKERQESKALWQKSWDEFIRRRAKPSGLDPLSELYFYETNKSKIVPVEKLRIVESVTPESIAGAEKNMRRVLIGEISRLKPLTVVARNDGKGTYCILDGNNIYSALVKRGVKNIPVLEIPRPYQKNVTTLEELYEINRKAQDEFNALMKDLQKELGGELKVRPSLKGEARVREKAKNQFDGDYSRVIDVLAGTLIFESESEILNAVKRLKAKEGDTIKGLGHLI